MASNKERLLVGIFFFHRKLLSLMELPKLFDYTSPTQTLSVYVFILIFLSRPEDKFFKAILTRHVGLTNSNNKILNQLKRPLLKHCLLPGAQWKLLKTKTDLFHQPFKLTSFTTLVSLSWIQLKGSFKACRRWKLFLRQYQSVRCCNIEVELNFVRVFGNQGYFVIGFFQFDN